MWDNERTLKNLINHKLLCHWQYAVHTDTHGVNCTYTPSFRKSRVKSPERYEWRSNGKVNCPGKKNQFRKLLEFLQASFIVIMRKYRGEGVRRPLNGLRGQVQDLHTDLWGFINFVSVPLTSIGYFLCPLKLLTNSEQRRNVNNWSETLKRN